VNPGAPGFDVSGVAEEGAPRQSRHSDAGSGQGMSKERRTDPTTRPAGFAHIVKTTGSRKLNALPVQATGIASTTGMKTVSPHRSSR